jgi:3-phenylpropionate/trans-cinnamate dioxygenase ferredoxin subunit
LKKKLVGKVPRAELAPGVRRRLDYPPFHVLVTNVDGVAYAIEDTCNHAGESLQRGDLVGCHLSCPAHGYIFDIRSGELITPRGMCDAQRTFEVAIDGDDYVVYDEVLTLLSPPESRR